MNQINQRYGLVAIVSITVFVLLGVAIWKIPQMQVASLKEQIYLLNIFRNLGTSIDLKDLAKLEKLRIDAENAARTVIVQGVGGSFVFLTAFVAFLNYRETRRNVTIAEEKQVTERFSKAIEQLGNASIHVRLGAIYALERIAKDSDKDYWQVMEILTAYVRETSPYPPQKNKSSESLVETWLPPGTVSNSEKNLDPDNERPIATDTQAVLTVISRRKKSYGQGEENRLDFSKSNLSDANLNGAKLIGADLSSANLNSAKLIGANLSGANLSYANLSGTDLSGADLSGADLWSANLNSAKLIGANLSGANLKRAKLIGADLGSANLSGADLSNAKLSGTKLIGTNLCGANLCGANLWSANLWSANLSYANLSYANLSGADLSSANLSDANLSGANLSGVNLSGANLSGANLSGARNLTPEQVKEAQNWEKAKYSEEFRAQLGLPPEPSK